MVELCKSHTNTHGMLEELLSTPSNTCFLLFGQGFARKAVYAVIKTPLHQGIVQPQTVTNLKLVYHGGHSLLIFFRKIIQVCPLQHALVHLRISTISQFRGLGFNTHATMNSLYLYLPPFADRSSKVSVIQILNFCREAHLIFLVKKGPQREQGQSEFKLEKAQHRALCLPTVNTFKIPLPLIPNSIPL